MSAAIRAIIRRVGVGDGFNNTTTYPDATLDDWIADAEQDVPTCNLGDRSDRAVAYYTCHLMYQATSSAASSGGSLIKEKVGDVERAYSAGSSSSSSTSSKDKYWVMYQNLLGSIWRNSPMVLGYNA